MATTEELQERLLRARMDRARQGLAQQPQEQQERGAVEQRTLEAASGFNKGLAQVLGLPVDLVAAAMKAGGINVGDAPFGGSESIKRGLNKVGAATGGVAQDRTGRIIERIGEEVGATAVPLGGALAAGAKGVTSSVPILRQTLQAARNTPGRFAATELGVGASAGAGAAAGMEIAPDTPAAELAGSLIGGLAPTGVAAGVRGLVRGGESGRQAVAEAVDLFGRTGANPTVGQATGGRVSQGIETVLSKAPGSGARMAKAAEKAADDIASRVNTIADDLSRKGTAEVAGRTIETGITGSGGFVERFSNKAHTLFNAIDNHLTPNKPVSVENTNQALRELTAGIPGAENLSGVLANPKINQIQKAFALDIGTDKKLPYTALKTLRSQVGDLLSSSDIIADAPRAQLKRLYAALSRDMEGAAKEAGPEAVKAFQRANKFWKVGMQRVEDTLQKITNKTNPEDVFLAATRGKEGATTLRAVKRSLKPEEWDVVLSATLRRMGRAKGGSVGEFSLETYLTNWRNLAPEARNALVGGARYKEIGKDLDAIAKVAERIREGARVLDNPSGTAGQLANMGAGFTAGGALLAGDVTIPLAIGGAAVTANGAARLMTSPSFVKWLAKSSEIPLEQLPGHIARLSNAMRDESPETQEAAAAYLSELTQFDKPQEEAQ